MFTLKKRIEKIQDRCCIWCEVSHWSSGRQQEWITKTQPHTSFQTKPWVRLWWRYRNHFWMNWILFPILRGFELLESADGLVVTNPPTVRVSNEQKISEQDLINMVKIVPKYYYHCHNCHSNFFCISYDVRSSRRMYFLYASGRKQAADKAVTFR